MNRRGFQKRVRKWAVLTASATGAPPSVTEKLAEDVLLLWDKAGLKRRGELAESILAELRRLKGNESSI